MPYLTCATCHAAPLKLPRQVDGAWYALCTECLFETEVEAISPDGVAEPGFQVKCAAGMSQQQEADLRRPRATL